MARMRAIRESLEELDNNLLYVDYQEEDGTVYIGTETGTGAVYECKSIDDLKAAFNKYINIYYGE